MPNITTTFALLVTTTSAMEFVAAKETGITGIVINMIMVLNTDPNHADQLTCLIELSKFVSDSRSSK